MRPPVAPRLDFPVPRRRSTWAFGVALGLHLALLAFLRSDAGRTWVRTLAPGAVTRPERGGGGGSDRSREHAGGYISLPAAPASRPVALPKRPPVVSHPEPAAPVVSPVAPQPADTTRVAERAPAETSAAGESAGAGGGPGAGPG